MDYDLTRGYKKYDTAVKNLEGILDKIKVLFDVTTYQKELDDIKTQVESDNSLTEKMPFAGMQSDLEAFVFDDYVKKIQEIIEKLESEYQPFYETYLLYTKVNLNIAKISDENISDIIETTKRLIDTLNNLTNNLTDEQKVIINEAYKTIYNVLLYEEIFERNDILTYINTLNIGANKENLSRLLAHDLSKLSEEIIVNEDLNNIGNEGLGFDYFNEDIISQVSSKTVGETNSEYRTRKNQAINEVTTKAQELVAKKDELMTKYLENKYKIKNLQINKTILKVTALSIVLVPVITITAGYRIGKSKSNKIDEYKTITRTIDLETGNLIGNQQEDFDEHSTTYVATVLKCSPWHHNSLGSGFVRNVIAYDYINPDENTDDFHVTKDNLEGNLVEKYQYVEAKDTLDSNENTTDTSIIITETYQDKSISRKSTKYIIPFTLLGMGLGTIIPLLLAYARIYNTETIQSALYAIAEEIKKRKLDNEEIKNNLNKLKDEAEALQKELTDVEKKYGKINVDATTLKINLKKTK